MHAVATTVQHIDDLVDETEVGHRRVGHDRDPLDVLHVDEVADRVRLEVGLGRNLEPLQVVVAPTDALDVHEVHRRDVVGDGVASVRTATEGQRRHERVVDVADATEGRGGVLDDADGANALGELVDDALVVAVDRAGVAEAVEVDHLLRERDAFFGVLGAKHRQHGSKLFAGQRLLGSDDGALGKDHRGVFGNREAGLFGDPHRRLADDLRVELGLAAVLGVRVDAEDELFELALLVGVHDVGVQARELGHSLGRDRLVEDDCLLGGAHHAVVERLGQHDVVDGAADLGGAFDEGRHVSSADTQCGLAAGVCRANHRVATGREDQRDTGVVHEFTGCLK